MNTIEIDGEQYALVPINKAKRQQRAIKELKEIYRNALKYPDLNCSYPLDALTLCLRNLLGSKWNEYILTLKAEIFDSLADNDADFGDLEESERPYTMDEYFNEILPQYMSADIIEDLWDGCF